MTTPRGIKTIRVKTHKPPRNRFAVPDTDNPSEHHKTGMDTDQYNMGCVLVPLIMLAGYEIVKLIF